MTVFTPANIHFTKANAMKLVKGGIITVKREHLAGEHPVFLTKSQLKRLDKARNGGKGSHFVLKFSKTQLRHHLKHGGGIWDSLKKYAGQAYETLKPVIREQGHKIVNKLAEHASPHINAAIGKLAGAAGKHIGHGNAATIAKHLQKFATVGLGKAKHKAHTTLTDHGLGLHSAGGRIKRKYVRKVKGGAVAGIPKSIPIRQGAS